MLFGHTEQQQGLVRLVCLRAAVRSFIILYESCVGKGVLSCLHLEGNFRKIHRWQLCWAFLKFSQVTLLPDPFSSIQVLFGRMMTANGGHILVLCTDILIV